MADNQQKYKLEVQQQEREIKSALTQLNAIYKQLKINLSILSILALFYLTISLFVIKTYNNINIYMCVCYHLIVILFALICVINLKCVIKKYKMYYNKGFEAWCKLADIADWSILRKYYYHNNEKLLPIKNVIDEFYIEFNRTLSPNRVHSKYLYHIVSITLLIYLSTIIFSLYWCLFK